MSKPKSENGDGLFPLADRLAREDWVKLGLGTATFAQKGLYTLRNIKATATGEMRPPKAGEWFLSGAVVQAYRQQHDGDTAYHIAELVLTSTETITVTRRIDAEELLELYAEKE